MARRPEAPTEYPRLRGRRQAQPGGQRSAGVCERDAGRVASAVRIADALTGVTSLGLDTSPFIYFIEVSPTYVVVCREVFRRISAGRPVGYTSLLTLVETLVHSLRNADTALEDQYRALLLGTIGIVSPPLDPATASRAAELR